MSSSPVCLITRTGAGFKRLSKGAWPGMMPSSPSVPATETICTRSENNCLSALTMSHCTVIGILISYDLFAALAVSFQHFVDGPLHVEVLLGNVIVITRKDALETGNGVFQRHKIGRAHV